MDGHLRAYSTMDGTVIWDFDTAQDFPTVNGVKAHGGSLTVDETPGGGATFVLTLPHACSDHRVPA